MFALVKLCWCTLPVFFRSVVMVALIVCGVPLGPMCGWLMTNRYGLRAHRPSRSTRTRCIRSVKVAARLDENQDCGPVTLELQLMPASRCWVPRLTLCSVLNRFAMSGR